jgi:Flp pilus assembly protein TadD
MLNTPLLVFCLLLSRATPQEATASQAEPATSASMIDSNAVQSLPLDAAQRSALQLALDHHDYNSAETLLVSVIQGNPKSSQVLAFLGLVSFLNSNFLNAAIVLKEAGALSPLDNCHRFILAMAYIRLERPDWARPEIERLANLDEKNPLYPYWLSRLDRGDMSFESAVANAQRAVELDPAFMKAYDDMGLSYEAMGKVDEAMKAYQQAIALDRQQKQDSPWPFLNLGALLRTAGRLREAEAALREALRCDPRLAQAHFQLGLVLEKQNMIQEAIGELQKATAYDPKYPEPYVALGRTYGRVGDRHKAEQAFAKFRELKELKSKNAEVRKQSQGRLEENALRPQ